MNRSMIDLWVGVFVAAGFGGLLFLALKVGNLASFSTDKGYQVQANFSNIGGLKVRGPVKSAGVVVGLDLTLPMLREGRKLAATRGLGYLRFVAADVQAIPFADASFERVISRIAPGSLTSRRERNPFRMAEA